ncbi:hypothetical protein [Nitrospirillum amazonense]|uniref:Uncharacterized protein n=1 Tax=Nitrospirillum amazonense TaxID=28077 RepID=A0A560JCD9_9PROT|nr:hypothetical protein [Nitrospirillum amazonense]MDG3439890.1 hypothetical protein [Nitrospirillum amazonense]TWB68706.1 hypothetical protein FBZ87_11014 [Nitrospirillum amazonense]
MVHAHSLHSLALLLLILGGLFALGFGFVLFHVPGEPADRRAILPYYCAAIVILMGTALLLDLGLAKGWPGLLFLVGLGVVALATSRVCSRCGIAVLPRSLVPPEHCAHCGHAFGGGRDDR